MKCVKNPNKRTITKPRVYKLIVRKASLKVRIHIMLDHTIMWRWARAFDMSIVTKETAVEFVVVQATSQRRRNACLKGGDIF